jgi:glycerophosphoryl diester phosphodiesterase
VRIPLANLYTRIPLIFAHRGASAEAPENTLPAFRLAVEQGADGLELDVTLSADGVPMVIHDDTLDRTTTGRGPVSGQPLAALQALDAGYPAKFGARFAGTRLSTLAEVFQALAPPALINVEIKHDRSPGLELAARVVEAIRAHHMSERVIVSSFQRSSLARVKQRAPELPVGLLYANGPLGPRWAHWLGGRKLPREADHPSALWLGSAGIGWCHQHGLRVNTWTVDDPAAMRRLIAAGVDGLITNVPAVAVRVRAGH